MFVIEHRNTLRKHSPTILQGTFRRQRAATVSTRCDCDLTEVGAAIVGKWLFLPVARCCKNILFADAKHPAFSLCFYGRDDTGGTPILVQGVFRNELNTGLAALQYLGLLDLHFHVMLHEAEHDILLLLGGESLRQALQVSFCILAIDSLFHTFEEGLNLPLILGRYLDGDSIRCVSHGTKQAEY